MAPAGARGRCYLKEKMKTKHTSTGGDCDSNSSDKKEEKFAYSDQTNCVRLLISRVINHAGCLGLALLKLRKSQTD